MSSKKQRNLIDIYFLILIIGLVPALYFIIAGSDWPIWAIIPQNYQWIFLEGDSTLYNFGLTYTGSFVFYFFVNYLPDRKRSKQEIYNFLLQTQQYMFTMATAILCDKDMPENFYLKLYKLPSEPFNFYNRYKYIEVLKVLYENYHIIEGSYWIYRGYTQKELNEVDREYLEKHISKLEECRIKYGNYARSMSQLLDELNGGYFYKILRKFNITK